MTSWRYKKCPVCGAEIEVYANPVPTVDIIIEVKGRGIVLIERKNPPYGWAIPGGFVDYGESVETAAVREAREETGLDVMLKGVLGVYSNPQRDSRVHTISTVFVAEAQGNPNAGDDAANARCFSSDNLPNELAFDHGLILAHYIKYLEGARCLCAVQHG